MKDDCRVAQPAVVLLHLPETGAVVDQFAWDLVPDVVVVAEGARDQNFQCQADVVERHQSSSPLRRVAGTVLGSATVAVHLFQVEAPGQCSRSGAMCGASGQRRQTTRTQHENARSWNVGLQTYYCCQTQSALSYGRVTHSLNCSAV